MKLSELGQTPQGVVVGSPGARGGVVVAVTPAYRPQVQVRPPISSAVFTQVAAKPVVTPSSVPGQTAVTTGAPTQTLTTVAVAAPAKPTEKIQPQQAPQPSPASVSSGGQVATTVSTSAPALAPVAVRGSTTGAPVKPLTAQGEMLKQPAQVAVSKPATAAPVTTPAQPSTSTPWLKYVLAAFGVLAVGYALTKKK